MSTFLTFVAAAGEGGGVHLPMPAWAFGVLALAVFALLLGFVWMFRHTAKTMIEGGHGTHGTNRGVPGHDPQPAHGYSDGRRH